VPEFKKEGYTGRGNGNPKNAGAFGSGGVPQEGTVAEFVKFFCNMDGENVGKLVYLGNKIKKDASRYIQVAKNEKNGWPENRRSKKILSKDSGSSSKRGNLLGWRISNGIKKEIRQAVIVT
jgi:hypothetical protein